MKPAAGVVILSSLVSLTTADALLAKDVPVGCATICGPVVDLSSKCTPLQSGNSEADSEANEGGNVWVGRRRADAPGVEDEPWEIYDDEELDRRFFTIQPAPTSFAPEFASLLDPNSVHVTTQQPPRPTRITPVIVASSSQPLSLPPTKAAPAVAAPLGSSTSSSEQEEISQAVPTPSPTSTTAIQGSKTAQSSMSLAKSPVSSTNGEVQCVCLNKSFNVPRVAALCTSCILQAGDANTSMIIHAPFC
jgi:hypothetical protein